ncbi:MAG: hypothetical protein O3A55_04800 [Bacteroidetes bacterium]|nr:hypothetical protein [Bacteroidota bacterium]
MDNQSHSIKFERTVNNDGTINFNFPVSEKLKVKPGDKVTIKVTAGVISEKLTKHKVTEEEIEKISKTQLEKIENVIEFLSVEGSLKNKKYFKKF